MIVFEAESTLTFGCVIFSIERITPPSGVALPVRLVRPADIVRGIFTLWQQRSTNAHSSSFIGRHRTSAFPFMLEQYKNLQLQLTPRILDVNTMKTVNALESICVTGIIALLKMMIVYRWLKRELGLLLST